MPIHIPRNGVLSKSLANWQICGNASDCAHKRLCSSMSVQLGDSQCCATVRPPMPCLISQINCAKQALQHLLATMLTKLNSKGQRTLPCSDQQKLVFLLMFWTLICYLRRLANKVHPSSRHKSPRSTGMSAVSRLFHMVRYSDLAVCVAT